ncbi:MAG: response regulator [Oceanospirillaceae bacterium]|nr:response regulator [Oceanospirillaceae bacterium]
MSNEKALIIAIDDDTFTLTSIKDALSSEYKVMLAMDPEAGLNLVLKHLPQLVILDINMPTLSGMEVAQMLRRVESTRTIPIVFLSGYDTPLEMKQAEQLGAEAFLIKPCTLEEVSRTVGEILNKQ